MRNMEVEKLKMSLERIEDPRRAKGGHILHKLENITIIGLCTIVCGGEDFLDMEEFGKEREEWLRKFLELPHGIPDSDTFRRVFERIDPEMLSECLYNWLGCHRKEGSVIAVDGKTIRGSKTDSHKAYHVVSAFAAENQLHWCLDIIFHEDASRACKDMSPLNMNVLRKNALALCKNADFGRRLSIQKKCFAAALNPLRLLDILFG